MRRPLFGRLLVKLEPEEKRTMHRIFFILLSALAFSLVTASSGLAKPFPEVNQDVRDKQVQEQLKAQPKALLVYAKGLCCPSCAIGIRKMISRLPFVDTTQANSGVELDAEHQLVTIAIKSNSKPDLQALADAIDEAGYEPVHTYVWQDNKVKTSKLAPTAFRVVP